MDSGLDTVIQSGASSTITTGSDLILETTGKTDIRSGGPIVIKGSVEYP